MDYGAQAHLPSSVRAEPSTYDMRPTMIHKKKRCDRSLRVTRVMKRFEESLVALEQDLWRTKEEILKSNEYFKELSRVKSQGQGLLMGVSRRSLVKIKGSRLQKIQAQNYIQVTEDFDALIKSVEKGCKADLNLTGVEKWQREVEKLCKASRACTERIIPPEVCRSSPQSSIQSFVSNQYRDCTFHLFSYLVC